eukprot:sb/3466289/
MALFGTGLFSLPDTLISISLLILLLLSSLMNPLVFNHNWRGARTLPKFLFRVLATVDFLTCLVIPLNSISQIAAPGPSPCSSNNTMVIAGDLYCEVQHHPTILQGVLSTVILTLIEAPSGITATLAICRYIQIRWPFRHLRTTYTAWIMAGYIGYNVATQAVIVFHRGSMYFTEIQIVRNFFLFSRKRSSVHLTSILSMWPSIMVQLVGIAASILTIISLFKRPKRISTAVGKKQHRSRKSSIKILITNATGLLYTALALLYLFHDLMEGMAGVYFIFVFLVILPAVLSCVNPMVYLLFTREALNIKREGGMKNKSFQMQRVSGRLSNMSGPGRSSVQNSTAVNQL